MEAEAEVVAGAREGEVLEARFSSSGIAVTLAAQ